MREREDMERSIYLLSLFSFLLFFSYLFLLFSFFIYLFQASTKTVNVPNLFNY